MATVRQQLVLAVVYSALCLAVCIAAFGLSEGWDAAIAVFMGGMIILVPSGWLAHKVASARGPHYAMASAMVKFALCGLGFALLFVLKPEIHAFAVFAGAATVLLALPVTTGLVQHKSRLNPH